MVTAVVAACAVVIVGGLAVAAILHARARSERRLEAVLQRIDGHLASISQSVAAAVEAVAGGVAAPNPAAPTLDFDELVDALMADAVGRTGADAGVLRVDGPGGRPVVATHGLSQAPEVPELAFAPPHEVPFRSATVEWAYDVLRDASSDPPFRSALATPLEAAPASGLVVVYARETGAFGPEHASILRGLVDDARMALANARRFAEVEARVNLDTVTSLPNRRGYELRLGRELSRAERSGRPLSVVVLGARGPQRSTGREVSALAQLLSRVTRKSDVTCRRGEHEFAVLLPGTGEAGATTLGARLEEEARALTSGTSSIAVGLVEWRPNESLDSFDARVEAALAPTAAAEVTVLEDVAARTASSHPEPAAAANGAEERPANLHADTLRRDALDALRGELDDAHRFGRSVALVALELDGFDGISARAGRDAADGLLAQVATFLDDGIGSGSVHRLGPSTFLVVLSGSSAHDAEALVGAAQGALEPPEPLDQATLSAGVTELAESDDAPAALGRAEHALWQAKQAGHGTVVIAVPGRRPAPPA